jgi:hypothetical protein
MINRNEIDALMDAENNRPIEDFEGYSPFEMQQLLYSTFGENSPIQLQKLTTEDYQKIPMLMQVKYLADIIAKAGEIKLTKKGYLPTKIVAELYQQGFLKEEYIEEEIFKLYKEADSMTVNLTRILLEMAGLTKKRFGKLSLTKRGEKIIADDYKLLCRLFETFAKKFNWAYYDGYEENQAGQLGFGFTLILLSKYGKEKRLDSFYANKYYKAFPQILHTFKRTYDTLERYATRCYYLRTFERFLDYFGLVTIEKKGRALNEVHYITKTDVFDKFIKCLPHRIRKR